MTATLTPTACAELERQAHDHLEQRRRALVTANRVRTARAELKRQIAEGELELSEVVRRADELEPELRGIALATLIESAPAFGKVRTNKTLRAARLAPSRPLDTLGTLERLRLATEILRHTPRNPGRSDAGEHTRTLRLSRAGGTLPMVTA